jgi:hypothetical protein
MRRVLSRISALSSALWLATTGTAFTQRPTDWCEVSGLTYTGKVYAIAGTRHDVSVGRCRNGFDDAPVFSFSPNTPVTVGPAYDDDIKLAFAGAPAPIQAGWIASRNQDAEDVLSDPTDELVARQVAIWSYIFGAPDFSLADGSVLDESRLGADGEPGADPGLLERARALRRRADEGNEPDHVYTNYTLGIRLAKRTYRDYSVVATLREGRKPINNKQLRFFVNDRVVGKGETVGGRVHYGDKKPPEIIDITVEWNVSKSAGKPLSVQEGTGPDLLQQISSRRRCRLK